jgi:dTDP-4-amino-4,6-dideoxygalactose transaminase
MIQGKTDWAYLCAAGKGGPGQALEERFQRELGVPFAVGTCGAGAALHIACMCVLEMGDEAITSPYSWGQTAACILQAGGVPIFADIDPNTLTLDPASVEARVTPRTRAIVAVHMAGVPADMDAINAVAARHGLTVIEDCAQAQGSLYKGRPVGTFGNFGCFSLGSGKHLAAGDAGMLVTSDRTLFEKALLVGMHPARMGKDIEDPQRRAEIDNFIYTYRINTLSAAWALAEMDRLAEMNTWRRRNLAQLFELLAGVPGIRPPHLPDWADPVWHMVNWTFVAEEVPGISRAQYVKALRAEGVPISTGYVGSPLHLRPTMRQKRYHFGRGYPWAADPASHFIEYAPGDCPVAERRCSELDMTTQTGWCYCDVSAIMKEFAAAFRKVTDHLDQVRGLEV